jgi:hypothetical protein
MRTPSCDNTRQRLSVYGSEIRTLILRVVAVSRTTMLTLSIRNDGGSLNTASMLDSDAM